MYHYDLAVTLATSLLGLPVVNAAIPHVQTLDAVTILSDNDLSGNLTTRTTGALLLTPSTYSAAAQRCASLNEKLWSPSHSKFSQGLDNALSYQAYLDGNNSLQHWISSSPTSNLCNTITTTGTLSQKPCTELAPALCTNSGPISSAGESDTRLELQVTFQSGTQNITGFRDFHTWQFRGIRFASQPERFTFSSLYESPNPINATKYGPGCLQAPDPRWPELSEDCLFLNVWTPYLPADSLRSKGKKKLKAVMVWIYGGGNTGGTGTDPEKEGGNLASRGDVVVVTFNYRVGNLGFLPFDDGVHNGNYGISDILTALRWIQRNIESFGGDPERVTIWGESAGATNVHALLAIEEAEGLFHGAIMQSRIGESDAPTIATLWNTPDVVYERTTKKVLQESGCPTNASSSDALACLRAYDALKWPEKGRTQAFFPVRDSHLLSTRALPLAGPLARPHNISVLIGLNRDEFSYLLTTPTTNFTANLLAIEGIAGTPLLHLSNSSYAPDHCPLWPSYTTAEKEAAVFTATSRLSTDLLFRCLTHAFAYSATRNDILNEVYEFEFNRTYQPARFTDEARVICGRDKEEPDREEYAKCHAGEVPYTFGNILQQGWEDRNGTDTLFARMIVDYWSGFVRTGTVNVEDGWLEARGFEESKAKMREAGGWEGDGSEVMRLQWSGLGRESINKDAVGCGELGLGKEFYESYDFGGE